ncbi:MAG: hypothetical protein II984_03570 [Clostridia bacterium]|nr:hypothetical protein [Clostridia bacterium]
MTEIETLKRAKMYMDKLAIGINPIDDKEVPENDVASNTRLLKCFSYISGVLTTLIKNEERKETYIPKAKRSPFYISPEEIEKFEFSKTPIFVSDVAERINRLIENHVKKLPVNALSRWLIETELVEEIFVNQVGRPIRKPTKLGEEIGITSEKRISKSGNDYFVMLFSESAQRFIVDNIYCITEFLSNKTKTAHANLGKKWDKEEENLLIKLYQDGQSIKEIAKTLQRTAGGIRKRLKILGIIAE